MKKNFKIGQTVVWRSQAGGAVTFKRGRIVAKVPPTKEDGFGVAMAKGLLNKYTMNPGFGSPRNHASFLVAVSKGGKAKPELYWPKVVSLEAESQF